MTAPSSQFLWAFTLVLVAQSCLTFYNAMDCSSPSSLCMEFPRQEPWSGLPFPSPGNLPNPGRFCTAGGFLTVWARECGLSKSSGKTRVEKSLVHPTESCICHVYTVTMNVVPLNLLKSYAIIRWEKNVEFFLAVLTVHMASLLEFPRGSRIAALVSGEKCWQLLPFLRSPALWRWTQCIHQVIIQAPSLLKLQYDQEPKLPLPNPWKKSPLKR